jgi:transposase
MTEDKPKLGRPPKHPGRPPAITPQLCEEISNYIRAGNYPETAAGLAGISRKTFYNWLRKGRSSKTNGVYKQFLHTIKEAEDYAEAAAVERIRKAGEPDDNGKGGNWTALAWWLERKHPEKWGRKDKLGLEHSGKLETEGKVVNVNVELPDDPAIRAAATDLVKSIRPRQDESCGPGDGGEQ